MEGADGMECSGERGMMFGRVRDGRGRGMREYDKGRRQSLIHIIVGMRGKGWDNYAVLQNGIISDNVRADKAGKMVARQWNGSTAMTA
jgi:hypothetical protein